MDNLADGRVSEVSETALAWAAGACSVRYLEISILTTSSMTLESVLEAASSGQDSSIL